MRLRVIAGAYAGTMRDFDFPAAQAALRSGMAERIEDAARPATAPGVAPPALPGAAGHDSKRRPRTR